MSLLRVSELRASEEAPSPSPWLPSHVQVTVCQARGLRAKGGPGDAAFVALQLGRQKHRTALASHKGGCPRWAEQCALELPPPPPARATAAAAPGPGAAAEEEEALLLQLTVWQRALVGMDRFLGRAALPLGALLQAGRAHQDRWYKLHSKPGKKEKERGEVQLSIQFTRHSLTASMFDLSIKEKPRSPFGKLKDRVRGRQKYDLESASAIVPSSSGGTLDEDPDPGGKRAKGKGFFFKSRLRKSSLTQSNTSLGSDSTASSAGSLGAFGTAEAMAPSPSWHSSLSTDHPGRDALPSPKLTHKRAFSDEVSQVLLPESKSVQSLKSQKEPISRSSLCINGSHIYCEEPSPKPSFLAPAPPPSAAPSPQTAVSRPEEDFGAGLHGLEPELPPWSSSSYQKGPPKDLPRFIPSPPILAAQEEDKLSVKTIALNKHRSRIKMEESRPVQVAAPIVFSAEARKAKAHGEEARREGDGERPSRTGFLRRRSSREDSRKEPAAVESGETLPGVAVTAGGRERSRSSSGGSWFALQDAREDTPKPSSPSGLLAATEDASCLEDHGPSPSITLGSPPAVPASQSPGGPESHPLVDTARDPFEWDDGFDALATSRLRPGGQRESPVLEASTDVVPTERLADSGGPEPAATVTRQSAVGRPQGGSKSPTLTNTPPEEALTGEACPGGQGARGLSAEEMPWVEASVDLASLAKAGGEELPREGLLPLEPAAGEPDTEGACVQALGQPLLPPAAPEMPSDARVQPWERSSGQGAILEQVLGEEETAALGLSQKREGAEPAVPQGANAQVSEDGTRGSPLASPSPWDSDSVEGVLALRTLAQGLEANEISLGVAQDDTGKEGHVETWEQGREAGCKAEPPPPKPPRRFTPLGLEKEVCGAQVRWREGVPPCGRKEVAPEGEGDWPHLPVAPVDLPVGPPTSPGPREIIGADAGRSRHVMEAPEDVVPAAAANELRGPSGGSGDAALAASGGAGRGEPFETCPKDNSCQLEDEDPTPPAAPQGLPELGLSQQAEESPTVRCDGRPQGSSSMLFWTALEEAQLQPEEQAPGEGGPAGLGPNPEQGHRVVLPVQQEVPAGSPESQALPAVPPLLWVPVGEPLGQRPKDGSAGGPGSSGWSDHRVLDFKKADFWQAEITGPSGKQAAVGTPGNPFAASTGPPPSPLNNPFVEMPPDVLLAEVAVLGVSPIEGCGAKDLCTETAPPGLLPAERQPLIRFPRGSRPLASSTPSVKASADLRDGRFPSPLVPPAARGSSGVSRQSAGQPPTAPLQPSADASAPSVLPVETHLAQEGPAWQVDSLHLVRPISSRPEPEPPSEEQRKEAIGQSPPWSGGQEKRDQRAAHGDVSSAVPALPLVKPESKRDPSGLDPSAKYYHLTHDELIQLLLKREAELGRKQEHVRELENYIDRLLVRIMEQSPTLLQIPLGGEAPASK